ncbi:hypothetical protein PLICRDRAFT_110179 [Plicaturopsis crispa FD-325 SS-3]|nr:hypothetical protein PLICRDRAFT_110179 [Plicaturopsis crispa FD-325 SS-3]
MTMCYNGDCLNPGTKQCSACKIVTYCSEKCQKAAWKQGHKMECAMNRRLRELQEEEEAKPQERPRRTHCTGCNVKFDHEYYADDDCPDCGYMACESCVSHHSRGSCYCQNSNFGRPYCIMDPAWYHMSSRTGKSYKGDRHPGNPEEYREGVLEDEPRECGNCHKVARCIKKEYLD